MSLPKANNSELPQSAPPGLIAITLSVVVVCFVGFSIVFFCRCFFGNMIQTWAFQRSASDTVLRLSSNNVSPSRGLDPSLLQSFPTFLYATIKDLRKEKNKCSLECAICLLEFEDHSMMRLLTICYHVFHQECIDLWLHSHKTCPVCRSDLDSPTNQTDKPQDNVCVEEEIRDHVCIDVKEGDGDRRHDAAAADDDNGDAVSMSLSVQEHEEPKFVRSHSTGHSIVMSRGGDEERDDEDDKYTLRLVEHAALKVLRGGHNYSKSCSSYKDITRLAAPCRNCGHVQTIFASSSRCAIQNI
ncbi:hypothetical protein VNO77_40257 [Canavalia gladiata]|uniref:RING-type E3 ubiquitin transferase n=1 Tax=Canavalia gladiata TaxID=3824 RepID=A0AAN9JZN5_CANGL